MHCFNARSADLFRIPGTITLIYDYDYVGVTMDVTVVMMGQMSLGPI